MVGAPGFEPGASCTQNKRATRLRHAPNLLCGLTAGERLGNHLITNIDIICGCYAALQL